MGGKVRKEVPNGPTSWLGHGDSFGEEILFGLTEKYEYTTVPESDTRLYMLLEDEFQDCFKSMPDVLEQMRMNFNDLGPSAGDSLPGSSRELLQGKGDVEKPSVAGADSDVVEQRQTNFNELGGPSTGGVERPAAAGAYSPMLSL